MTEPDKPAPELDIGHLDNETIFIPSEDDVDHEAEAMMHLGKVHENPENALRDPWFETDEGRAWATEQAGRAD